MNKKFRNHGVRLLAFMLTFIMLIGLVPASAASKKVKYLEPYISDATITVTDSKGNEILPGDSVAVGTTLTIKVTPDDCYEFVEGDRIEVDTFDDEGYFYEWTYMYLDKNLTTTYTVGDHNFYFYAYASAWYNLTIKGDKHVKAMTLISNDGTVKKEFSGRTANLKLSKETGFTNGYLNVQFTLDDGYVVSNSEVENGWCGGINSDGTYYYIASFSNNYDYENDTYTYDNNTVINVTTKKGKAEVIDYSSYAKLNTATATLNKSKEVLTLKAKKTIVTLGYYVYDSEWGQDEWLSTYDANFNAKNAKNVERIDLSKLTKVDKYTISSLVDYLVREYKKGNMPKLKAICLPKGYRVIVSETDGYMQYYPLVIYNAQ